MAGEPDSRNVIIEDLRKTYENGEVVACEDINLEIGNDELIVLLGPSGCGKTTTLRCVAGLETVDNGRIIIGGNDVTDLPPKDRDVAFVFQEVTLFPHKSVRGNMRFGLDMKTDLSQEEKAARIQEAAELLGIEELLDRKPSALSGGQRQRVSLGRAMVMEPQAFLLDEPFSALDANLRDQMQTEIQRLQHEVGRSMIFVTHDQDEAMTIGDRIAVMRDGRILQLGTPYEIYNDPENLFVAEFIGSPPTNVVPCEIERAGSHAVLSSEAFSLELSDQRSESLGEYSGPIHLAVRPANFELASADGLFDATIDVVETLGERDAVYLSSNGLEFVALADPGEFSEDTTVSVNIDESDVWLFADDGSRLD